MVFPQEDTTYKRIIKLTCQIRMDEYLLSVKEELLSFISS